MIAAFLIEPAPGGLGLDDLVGERLGHAMIPIEAVIGSGDDEVSMADLPPEAIRDYAAEDADFTLRLAEHLAPEIDSLGLRRVLDELELPLIEVLVEMEREGITLDVERLREQQGELEREASRLEREIHAAAGEEFNVASPKQLQGILFEKLGLPVQAKTKTGPSTSAEVLEELALLRPDVTVPALVLEHRRLAKLLSTYITALPEFVKPSTGRLHTDFRQTVAATGRLSSLEPNLQNIPVRGEAGRQIRRAFVPNRPGEIFLSADYSQIELRILAHLSGDPSLVAALRAGEDIHAAVAARIHDKRIEDVTREERAAAKAVNFGLIYGMGAFGLARGLRIGRQAAQEFIETFFARFPGVRDFIEATKESARESGEVRTLFGRRRPVPEIHSRLPRERAQGERVAVNSVVQGSAADVIKKAMIDIHRSLAERRSRARLLLQIHDELLLEVPAEDREEEERHLRERMEGVVPLDVPLVVTVSTGNDWYDAGK
jgi:DNA polymerase-1